MAKVICSAIIERDPERQAIIAWVRCVANGGFSEIGNKVSMTYIEQPDDPDNSSRKWGIIHTFEQYPEHAIEYLNG